MFAITDAATATAADGLLIPPGAVAVQDGPPIEEVLFLRDEMANLAWAVERSVQGPSGAARDRARERDDPPAAGARVRSTRRSSTTCCRPACPARWIPYLPRSSGYRAIELVQGGMPDADGTPVPPLGRLLNTGDVRTLKDAEIPREGIVVRRQPSVTRRADGSWRVDDPPRRRRPRRGRQPARVRLGDPPEATTKRPTVVAIEDAGCPVPACISRVADERLELAGMRTNRPNTRPPPRTPPWTVRGRVTRGRRETARRVALKAWRSRLSRLLRPTCQGCMRTALQLCARAGETRFG